MKPIIFFDLDGTILDSRKRLYELFQFLVKESSLSYQGYWSLKHDRQNHKTILINNFDYDEIKFKTFEKEWFRLIESEEYLALDFLYPNVDRLLEQLKSNYSLVVVTARQSRENTLDQLKANGVLEFFEKVLVTEQKKTKEKLISEEFPNINSEHSWMVGDTGHDIRCGKYFHLKTAAMTHGFSSENYLSTFSPDIICDNILNLIKRLQ